MHLLKYARTLYLAPCPLSIYLKFLFLSVLIILCQIFLESMQLPSPVSIVQDSGAKNNSVILTSVS